MYNMGKGPDMSGKAGRTSRFAAVVLVGVNFVIMLVCAVLFSLALWMISSPGTLSASIQGFTTPAVRALLNPQTLTVQLGVGLSALVIFFFCLSFMGLYGAVTRSQFLLFMYATLVLLLLLLECALLYYFSSNLLEKGLQEQDGQWTHALRLAFQCCEHNATTVREVKLPWSCCGAQGYPNNCTTLLLSSKNCNVTIPHFLHRYTTAIYASLAVLHIVVSSCAILRRARGYYGPR